LRKWQKLMRNLRGIWNVLLLAAGARFGYVLYTEPAARATAKDWLVWWATGGFFREESARQIVVHIVLLLAIVAFFDAVRSTLISLFRWFSPTTRRLRCPSCNRIIGRADKFCANCGSPIHGAELEKNQTSAIAKPARRAGILTITPADINNKSRSNMVGVAFILLLVTMFVFFWLVSRNGLDL
jgi:hypothetical protein